MELIYTPLNFIQHLDQHLLVFISSHGASAYAVLFAIIFCETGLVILPFLPGDSLLFAAGSLAACTNQVLGIHMLFFLLVIASTTGNGVNYWIGRKVGVKIFSSERSWLLNKRHLDEAHRFYQRHGGKTIVLARFIPILRTFVPFVAGIGYMSSVPFFLFNLVSALLWTGSLLYGGYLFSHLPFIKDHFSVIILSIALIPFILPLFQFIRSYLIYAHGFKKN